MRDAARKRAHSGDKSYDCPPVHGEKSAYEVEPPRRQRRLRVGWRAVGLSAAAVALVLSLQRGHHAAERSSWFQVAHGDVLSHVASSVVDAALSLAPETVRPFHGVALLTVASHAKASVNSGVEYGEMKAAFVYPVSVDNKARYCAVFGCTLVVGGPVPEAAGRSARWLKVAWLRRCFWRCALCRLQRRP